MNLLYFRSSKREPGRSSCGPRATRCLEEHFRLLEQLLVLIYILGITAGYCCRHRERPRQGPGVSCYSLRPSGET